MTDIQKLMNMLNNIPSNRLRDALSYFGDADGGSQVYLRQIAEWVISGEDTIDPEHVQFILAEADDALSGIQHRARAVAAILGNIDGDGKYASDLAGVISAVRNALDCARDYDTDMGAVRAELSYVD